MLYNRVNVHTCRALKSPQILELSGIGNNTLLESIGVIALLNLPSVGENLQEHMNFHLTYGQYDSVKHGKAPLKPDSPQSFPRMSTTLLLTFYETPKVMKNI